MLYLLLSLLLKPLVHLHVVNFFNKREDAELKAALISALERLEKGFLSNNNIQALYPIVWSTLYPLVASNALRGIYQLTYSSRYLSLLYP